MIWTGYSLGQIPALHWRAGDTFNYQIIQLQITDLAELDLVNPDAYEIEISVPRANTPIGLRFIRTELTLEIIKRDKTGTTLKASCRETDRFDVEKRLDSSARTFSCFCKLNNEGYWVESGLNIDDMRALDGLDLATDENLLVTHTYARQVLLTRGDMSRRTEFVSDGQYGMSWKYKRAGGGSADIKYVWAAMGLVNLSETIAPLELLEDLNALPRYHNAADRYKLVAILGDRERDRLIALSKERLGGEDAYAKYVEDTEEKWGFVRKRPGGGDSGR